MILQGRSSRLRPRRFVSVLRSHSVWAQATITGRRGHSGAGPRRAGRGIESAFIDRCVRLHGQQGIAGRRLSRALHRHFYAPGFSTLC